MKLTVFILLSIVNSVVHAQTLDLEKALTDYNEVSTCKYYSAGIREISECNEWDLSLIEKGASCSRAFVKDDPENKLYLLLQKNNGGTKIVARMYKEESGQNIVITSGCPF